MSQVKVQCPCCRGKKWLVVQWQERGQYQRAEPCTHCMGEGVVEAEVFDAEPEERTVPRWQ